MLFMQQNDPVRQLTESPVTSNDNNKKKMGHASLCNLPEELTTNIIVSALKYDEDAGLREFLILASVCVRIRRICASTASHVIWDVGARSMAAFEDAIIAVSSSEDVE